MNFLDFYSTLYQDKVERKDKVLDSYIRRNDEDKKIPGRTPGMTENEIATRTLAMTRARRAHQG